MPVLWQPTRLLDGAASRDQNFALIILNTPINPNSFEAVIDQASQVICADGGANILYGYYSSKTESEDIDSLLPGKSSLRFPDAIVGDLDSLKPEIESFFRQRNVIIHKESDQNSTDFAKCLRFLRTGLEANSSVDRVDSKMASKSNLDIVVLGGISGRIDQGLSLLHYMYLAYADPTLLQGRMYLLSSQSLSFILSPGLNIIDFDLTHSKPHTQEISNLGPLDKFTENIGIIPLSGPTTITTRGLEWDVTDWPTQFGSGMMSTSNHIRLGTVEIEVKGHREETPNLPLFTVELAKQLATSREAKKEDLTRAMD